MAANQAAAVYKDGLLQVPSAKKIIDMVDPTRRSPVIGELSGRGQSDGENEASANLESQSSPPDTLPLEDNKFIVFFKHNSNQLPQETLDTLDRIIDLVTDHQITTVRVTGYTDSYGDRLYNVMLSAERANRVKAYLVEGGVPASKIEVSGLGPENPIESNATLEGRKKNRRVEIELGRGDSEEGRQLTA
jgi:outer membrane protein OmpA-like peptidoglycan-associated protein